MKIFSKIGVMIIAFLAILTACEKVPDLPFYEPVASTGGPVLTASATNWAPLPADSNNIGLRFNWTRPAYTVDSNSIKYVVEIDSATKNFRNPVVRTLNGSLTTSFLNKELNNIFLNTLRLNFNTTYTFEIRVTSSHANNNEPLRSNVLSIRFTPYKVPPRVALPASNRLFLVGSATQGGWNNPVPTPSQEFARLDETTWAGVFQLNASSEYLVLPVNGDWGNKYAITLSANNTPRVTGSFGFNSNDNFPGPTAAGMYLITLNFQQGTYTVAPFTGPNLPTNLFLVGGATPGGWNNPVPVPSQQFTRINSSVWELTINLSANGEFLILPVNGDWGNKYSVANKSLSGLSAGGDFGYNLNDNFPGPSTAGSYKITTNFATGKFTTVRQ